MAKPVNDKIHDALTMRQVDLVRLANGVSGSLTSGIMRNADDKIVSRLALIEGRLTPKQLAALEERLTNILAVQERQMRKALNAHLGNLVTDEIDNTAGLLARVFKPLGIEPKSAAAGAALRRARREPVRGVPMGRMFQRFFRNDRERTLATVRSGLQAGQSGPQLARSVVGSASRRFLDGVRQVSRRSVDTMVQTISTHAVAQTRSLMYESNPDLIREERWVSTLDARTSDICQSLDGRVFPINQGIHPPAHPNCRSARMPIVPSIRALPVDDKQFLPSTAKEAFDGKGPQVLTYDKWLKGQPAKVQREVLGPTRFALFQTGEIELRGFVNDRGTRRTLPELRARSPKIFDMAGLTDD
jgi:SPP1 gp7 family putative phage head morphogenesis protein